MPATVVTEAAATLAATCRPGCSWNEKLLGPSFLFRGPLELPRSRQVPKTRPSIAHQFRNCCTFPMDRLYLISQRD